MIKIILIIGEVTRNHYQRLRIEMLRSGHKPRIVRFDHEELTALYEKYGDQFGLEGPQAISHVLSEKDVKSQDVYTLITNVPCSDGNPATGEAMDALSECLTRLDNKFLVDHEGYLIET